MQKSERLHVPDRIELQSAQVQTLAIILGGGAGARLFPLTRDRSKPAVPLGGKYRLVDIPISNCLNYGFNKVYVLTQFNSMSLHSHIKSAYRFDGFGKSFGIMQTTRKPHHSGLVAVAGFTAPLLTKMSTLVMAL
jgi:glucose-1-phosphate adenylyltransferase